MYGIYINENEVPYAQMIAHGHKVYETRTKNMLGKLTGERVALVRTHRNSKPYIVGYATISDAFHATQAECYLLRREIAVPSWSKHYSDERGKWLYRMENPETDDSLTPLPENIIRHGRSYCEF